MNARREFLKTAGIFLVTASCNPEKLFGPQCGRPLPPIDDLTRRDILISSGDLDEQLASLPKTEAQSLHLEGSFETRGVYRWGQYATRNLGENWTVQGDAEISLVPTVRDNQPLYCLAGPASRVSGITVRGNHSQLASNWSGSLRTGGVLIEGDGSIDGVTFRDFGSKGTESFVATVSNGLGFASITNCVFTDFDPSRSDTQVTVYSITAADRATETLRSDCLMEGNRTFGSGSNWVQGHTIYQTEKGVVRNNYSDGARLGYYGDYYTTKGVEIYGNRFRGCEHGVQLVLAPTPLPDALSFSHEGYQIGENEIESWGAQVSLNTLGPTTETRFIRDIAIHPSLSVESFGAIWNRSLRCAA